MMPFTPRSGQALLYYVLFPSLALAVPQNVTVDDAALTGDVVPQYLPSVSRWNVNRDNNCTKCYVKLDPSLTYDGTWHDATYHPAAGFTQAIEFTFTGSGLYIFFILANNVRGADTLTTVDFILDQVTVSTYKHVPSTSTNYQYNVPVYADDSLDMDEHTMLIRPSTSSNNNVLILFDYLIYTMDSSSYPVPAPPPAPPPLSSSLSLPTMSNSPSTSATLPSSPTLTAVGDSSPASTTLLPLPTSVSEISDPSASATATSSSSQTSVRTGTFSALKIGAIVGGTVGGIAILVVVLVFLLWCWRQKRSSNPPREVPVFILPREVNSASFIGTTRSSVINPTARSSTAVSSTIPQTSNSPASITTPSFGAASSGDHSALLEQVELLRGEVASLRRQQAVNQVEASRGRARTTLRRADNRTGPRPIGRLRRPRTRSTALSLLDTV